MMPSKNVLFDVPSGYDIHSLRTGKIHHAIKNGKPSISIRAIYTMAMLNNRRVSIICDHMKNLC